MKSKSVSLLPLMVAMVTCISCGRGRTLSDLGSSDSVAVEDSVEEDSVLFFEEEDEGLSLERQKTEAFADFIFAFTHSGRFQAERIRFPLPVTDAEGQESTIRSGRQFREEFNLPGNDYYTLILGDKSQMDVLQDDSALHAVTLQHIRLGHHKAVNYHFTRTNGRWYLASRRCEALQPHVSDFLTFYNHFSTDSLFQQESLARELFFSMDDPDMGGIEGIIEPDQWPSFRPVMPTEEFVNIDFGQTFPHPHRIYFLQCGLSNGMLDIFTFRHEDGRWKLTAYEN